MFELLFQRSADAMSLFDPRSGRFLESNAAAVRLLGAPDAKWLANISPADLSPERQPDGRLSAEKSEEMVRLALARGSHRFEWTARRHDGSEIFLDVVLTLLNSGDRPVVLSMSRDVSEWKRTEAALRESEQKLRALFE